MKTLKESILGNINTDSESIILDELKNLLDPYHFYNIESCKLSTPGVLTLNYKTASQILFTSKSLVRLKDNFGIETIRIDERVFFGIELEDSTSIQNINIQLTHPDSSIRIYNGKKSGTVNACKFQAGGISINAGEKKLEVTNCEFKIIKDKPEINTEFQNFCLVLQGFKVGTYKWRDNKLYGTPIVKFEDLSDTHTMAKQIQKKGIKLPKENLKGLTIQKDILSVLGLDCGKNVKMIIFYSNYGGSVYAFKKPDNGGAWDIIVTTATRLAPFYKIYKI